MANLYEPEFESSSERPGFGWRRAPLGRQAGGERLGASLFALAPGQALFPLHYHLGNEELLVVVEGSPSLRTMSGERPLERGEVVSFPRGEEGAHQVVNRSVAEARVLLVSEMNSPEVVVRPESGKLSAFGRAPGAPEGEGMHRVFFERDEVPLWEAEGPPPPSR